MHKIAALALAAVAVAFLVATDVTEASTERRLVGPTSAVRAAEAAADEIAAAELAADEDVSAGADRPTAEEEAAAEAAEAEETAVVDEAVEVARAAATDHEAQPASTTAAPDARPEPFATVDGVDLHPVSDAVVVTGFHEAGRSNRPLALEPTEAAPAVGRPRDGAPPVSDPTALTLPSRGRGTAPTSAVDIALPAGEAIASPVSGRVADVEVYALYGRIDDVIVTIIPDRRPDLQVAVLHVDGIRVKPGQRVTAGETVIADSARVLPFRSQVERHSGEMPHVHVEVRPAEERAKTA